MAIEFREPRTVKLRHLNIRTEKHGDEDRRAIDMGLVLVGGNRELDMLDPALRTMLFKPLEASQDAQGELPTDDLPSVRCARLKTPLHITLDQVGMTARIAYGIEEEPSIVLGLVKVSKVQIAQVMEGGSVALWFNASTSSLDVSDDVVGKLSGLVAHEITMSLALPEVKEEPKRDERKEAEAQVSPGFLERDDTPQPTAEDIFTAGATE